MCVLFPLGETAKEYMKKSKSILHISNEKIAKKLISAYLSNMLIDSTVITYAKNQGYDLYENSDLMVEVLAEADKWFNKFYNINKKN